MASAEPPTFIYRKRTIISLQPFLVLLRLLLQGLDLVSELLHQRKFLLDVVLLLLFHLLSLCLMFRIELENRLANLIISNRPLNRGSVHGARGHTINIVSPYVVDAVLVRIADCICPHHVLVNRWTVLGAMHSLLGLLEPNLLQSLHELDLQLQLSETN